MKKVVDFGFSRELKRNIWLETSDKYGYICVKKPNFSYISKNRISKEELNKCIKNGLNYTVDVFKSVVAKRGGYI